MGFDLHWSSSSSQFHRQTANTDGAYQQQTMFARTKHSWRTVAHQVCHLLDVHAVLTPTEGKKNRFLHVIPVKVPCLAIANSCDSPVI